MVPPPGGEVKAEGVRRGVDVPAVLALVDTEGAFDDVVGDERRPLALKLLGVFLQVDCLGMGDEAVIRRNLMKETCP